MGPIPTVPLTVDSAVLVAQAILRLTSRSDAPAVAAKLDAGDVQGAAEAFAAPLEEGRSV